MKNQKKVLETIKALPNNFDLFDFWAAACYNVALAPPWSSDFVSALLARESVAKDILAGATTPADCRSLHVTSVVAVAKSTATAPYHSFGTGTVLEETCDALGSGWHVSPSEIKITALVVRLLHSELASETPDHDKLYSLWTVLRQIKQDALGLPSYNSSAAPHDRIEGVVAELLGDPVQLLDRPLDRRRAEGDLMDAVQSFCRDPQSQRTVLASAMISLDALAGRSHRHFGDAYGWRATPDHMRRARSF